MDKKRRIKFLDKSESPTASIELVPLATTSMNLGKSACTFATSKLSVSESQLRRWQDARHQFRLRRIRGIGWSVILCIAVVLQLLQLLLFPLWKLVEYDPCNLRDSPNPMEPTMLWWVVYTLAALATICPAFFYHYRAGSVVTDRIGRRMVLLWRCCWINSLCFALALLMEGCSEEMQLKLPIALLFSSRQIFGRLSEFAYLKVMLKRVDTLDLAWASRDEGPFARSVSTRCLLRCAFLLCGSFIFWELIVSRNSLAKVWMPGAQVHWKIYRGAGVVFFGSMAILLGFVHERMWGTLTNTLNCADIALASEGADFGHTLSQCISPSSSFKESTEVTRQTSPQSPDITPKHFNSSSGLPKHANSKVLNNITASKAIGSTVVGSLGFSKFSCDFLPRTSIVWSELLWARRVLRRMRVAVCIPCALRICVNVVKGMVYIAAILSTDSSAWMERFDRSLVGQLCFFTTRAAILVDVYTVLFTSGIFETANPCYSIPKRLKIELQLNTNVPDKPLRSVAWTSKVERLSKRSITAQSLLDFYSKLGSELMPNFDPMMSTTNDVVRQVVIPLTRTSTGGEAYADAFASPSDLVTHIAMVTHTWTSLFVHLVAAILADALEIQDGYSELAFDLINGRFNYVRERLEEFGPSLAQRRYWVCCFCVNQHTTICGGFSCEPTDSCSDAHQRWTMLRHDSATGREHPLCYCSQPKHLFGDECEINAFDDMLELMHKNAAATGQVLRHMIAIDQDYSVFFRAWCVAEIVTLQRLGIQQHIQILYATVLALDCENLQVYKKLTALSVRSCEASRPEDKEFILRRIGYDNIETFDRYLQFVIFGEAGLLQKQFHGFHTLEAAVMAVRRFYNLVQCD